jgi:DNA-binding CsgD family transcriptional regulator
MHLGMVAGTGVALLERGAELQAAGTVLSAARDGAGGTLLVEGPAGIGKSALIRAIRRRAEDEGFAILAARGAELEHEFSFGVVRQLFEPALASRQGAEREALLAGAARLAEPAIGELELPGTADISPPLDPSFAVLHGLYWLTSNLAERSPLVIAVDDAHWSDPASLRFLGYLAGRLEGLPVTLIVGLRPFELGAASKLIDALDAEATTRVIHLAPLSGAGTDALVRARVGAEPAPGFAAACHRASGGNPQLIQELLAALAAEGVEPTPAGAAHIADLRADRIAASVLIRVGRLGEAAVAVARAVAVLGREASPELAAAVAELDPAQAAAAVDALVAHEVLVGGDTLAFVHPIVRTAVYGDFSPALRGTAHRRAATLLAERGAELESVAAQIVAAPPAGDPWAVAELARAGLRALEHGAPEAAVSYLERALVEGPDPDARREVLIGLGRGFAMLRDGRSCIKCLYEALDLTEDTRQRAEIVHLLITMLSISRAAARGIALLHREIAALPESERALGLRLESDIDSISFFSLTAKRAAAGRKRRFHDADDPGLLASAAVRAAIYHGTAKRAVALARSAYAGGRLLEREGPDAPSVWMVGTALLFANELEGGRSVGIDWNRAARQAGSLRAFSLASLMLTRTLHWMGDLAEAEAEARAFLEGMPEAVGAGPAFLADILADQGRIDEAEEVLTLGDRAHALVGWSFFYPMLLQSRGTLAARRGRLEDARASLLESGRLAEEWGVQTPGPFSWRVHLAEVYSALGDHEEARLVADSEVERARVFGAPRPLGIALRAAGMARADGIALLSEAVAVLGRSTARLEHARALVELGATLRRSGRAADAREPLREGLAGARACGALPLAERAYEELTTTGARPRKIVRAGAEALTSSERRVARMAADGMPNKEIAQALFVTVRTVEAHLHHAYQKLGISSRRELAEALER